VALLAGVAIGAGSVGGLNAQGKAPGAYAVFTYTDIPDPAGFKEHVGNNAQQVISSSGGQLLARAAAPDEFIILRPGDTPWQLKRWALIGFENAQKAKDFWAAQAGQEGRKYIEEHTKGRAFVVEALKQ
jgi:uncharacterized protein (DUF1330 family)